MRKSSPCSPERASRPAGRAATEDALRDVLFSHGGAARYVIIARFVRTGHPFAEVLLVAFRNDLSPLYYGGGRMWSWLLAPPYRALFPSAAAHGQCPTLTDAYGKLHGLYSRLPEADRLALLSGELRAA